MSRQTLLGDGRIPLICVPLVSKTQVDLVADAQAVVSQSPDVIEWRVDHFDEIKSHSVVLAAGNSLRKITKSCPLIFTLRSSAEGGRELSLSSSEVNELRLMMADQSPFDFLDVEMRLLETHVNELVEKTHRRERKVILSAHDFHGTPSDDALREYFLRAYQLGGDIAKVAVMPKTPDDVLRLLSVTRHMSESLPIPVISMSMGSLGLMSRIFGGVFGSALTFATGAGESAPGQIALDDLRAILSSVG